MSMTALILSSLASSMLVTLGLLLVIKLLGKRKATDDYLDARIVALIARWLDAGSLPDAVLLPEVEALLSGPRARDYARDQHRVLEWLRERGRPGAGAEGEIVEPAAEPKPSRPASIGLAHVRPTRIDTGEFAAQMAAIEDADGDEAEAQVQVGELSTALCFDADPDRRANAAISLGRLAHPSGVPHLVTALRTDSTERVRTLSAVALGMIGSRDAISPLIDVIQQQIGDRLDVSSEITYGGFQLIRTLQREIDPEPTDWLGQDPVAAQIWALGRIGSPQACAALCERLSDSDPGIRWFAAWALGKIGDESTVPALAALLDDRSTEVRWIAIWSLGRMNTTRAIPSLIEKARDPDASIRRIAVWALGRSGDLRARETVLRALTDPERGVRQVASWALSQIDAGVREIA
jgi:HEAT repeat protein